MMPDGVSNLGLANRRHVVTRGVRASRSKMALLRCRPVEPTRVSRASSSSGFHVSLGHPTPRTREGYVSVTVGACFTDGQLKENVSVLGRVASAIACDNARLRIFLDCPSPENDELATRPKGVRDAIVDGVDATLYEVTTLGRCRFHEHKEPPGTDDRRNGVHAR